MNNANPDFSALAAPELPEPGPTLNPVAVLFALGSPVRWPIVQMLADGSEMTATGVAEALGRNFDAISKHLWVLENAGVVEARIGEDRRQTFFFIPARHRVEPRVLDYGVCRVRLRET
jgi:predicted transcriptional regulator